MGVTLFFVATVWEEFGENSPRLFVGGWREGWTCAYRLIDDLFGGWRSEWWTCAYRLIDDLFQELESRVLCSIQVYIQRFISLFLWRLNKIAILLKECCRFTLNTLEKKTMCYHMYIHWRVPTQFVFICKSTGIQVDWDIFSRKNHP